MHSQIRCYHPDLAEMAGAGPSTDDHAIDQPQDGAFADNEASDEDDTILGLGPNSSAGGLSGDGERTDEYDAAVMGIGD